MLWVKGAAALVCLGLGAVAEAATVNFYYAGRPGAVSNQPDPADRALFNTGLLTVDRGLLADGPSLANRTIRYTPYEDDPDPSAGAVSFDFALGMGTEEVSFDLTFDAEENLTSWHFTSFFMITPPGWDDFRVSSFGDFGDAYYRLDGSGNTAYWNALDVLGGLGMSEGSPEFQFHHCGGWAGPGFSCPEWDDEPSHAWAASFLAFGAGEWFRDDLLGFAAQVQSNTIAALADLPRSYHDIAPAAIPLPAPFLLMGSALASLALLRRRRSAAGGDSGKIIEH